MSRNVSLKIETTPVKRPNFTNLMDITAKNVLNSERKRVFTIDHETKIPNLKEHYSPERTLERMDSLSRIPHHRRASLKFNGDPITR